MLKIAVIGNFLEIKKALKSIFNFNFLLITINKNFNENNLDCDILIIDDLIYSKTLYIPEKCTILLNIDNINSNSVHIYCKNIITYGINSNSEITFSSIEKNKDSKIQFCIQKRLKSFSGKTIYEQEFPIYYNLKSLYAVLSCVTIALLNDINFN